MIRIAFLCSWGQSPQELYNKYKLYTPNRSGSWNNLKGVPKIEDADVVFMMESPGISRPELIEKLRTKKLFVIRHEPPDVISSSRLGLNAIPQELREKTTLVDYETQPIWFFSKWELAYSHTHEDFLSMQHSERTSKLSCLVSNKSFVPGHIKRLNFIKKLILEEPELLTLFGRNKINYRSHMGSLSAEKKYLAYEGFEYTLCFENSRIQNYFSDKMFDAMLMWSMPIYWGAPNVADYLPSDSFHMLSENLDEGDLERVKDICKGQPSEKNIKALKEARQLILEKYSLWPSLQYVLENF